MVAGVAALLTCASALFVGGSMLGAVLALGFGVELGAAWY